MGRSRGLKAAVLAAVLLFATSTYAAQPFPVTEIASGIFVREGVDQDASAANDDAIANIGFIVGHDAVAVIDPGGSRGDGERLLATIAANTRLPIRYVVMTHGHPDHVFGAAAFVPAHPVFVGHAGLPGFLAARGAYYRDKLAGIIGKDRVGDYVVPTMLVQDHAILDLGGRTLELTAAGTAHTDSDLAIYDPTTRTLWAGDLLFVRRIPALDGNLSGWLRALDALASVPALRAVPGHGPVSVPWPAGAADERRYLETIRRETRAVLDRGGSIEQAIATVGQGERGRWALFDDYNGRNVTEAFKELEWE